MIEPDPIDYPTTQFQDAGDEYVAWTPPTAAHLTTPPTYSRQGRIQLPVCSHCCAVVMDEQGHSEWHAALFLATSARPDSGQSS